MVDFLSRLRVRTLRQIVGQSSQVFVDVVFPRTRAGCNARGHWLCSYCDASIERIGDSRCDRCGIQPRPRSGCWCAKMSVDLVRARSAYEFERWPRTMVHRTKYGGEFARSRWMASRMALLLEDFGPIDGLVPVPLHRTKLAQRGFNQSDLLARAVGEMSGVPVMPILERTRATTPQVKLSLAERADNVADAFQLDRRWRPEAGKHFVLVDDVRTSGATINACARVLRQIPGVRIGVLTFAVAR